MNAKLVRQRSVPNLGSQVSLRAVRAQSSEFHPARCLGIPGDWSHGSVAGEAGFESGRILAHGMLRSMVDLWIYGCFDCRRAKSDASRLMPWPGLTGPDLVGRSQSPPAASMAVGSKLR